MDEIIQVQHLSRRYGRLLAVDDISFTVQRGSTFAFLGPNGAGKSTTISCLTTLAPFKGTITINGRAVGGRDDARIRQDLGVVFQKSLLDPTLTVWDNLLTRARFYGVAEKAARDNLNEIAELINIQPILRRKYGQLSGGQARRVDIARALVHRPEILFLDEPTTGLDPQGRNVVWQTITKLQREFGLTVFLTTHYLEETERAEQVYLIDHGRILTHGTPASLRAKYAPDTLRLIPFAADDAQVTSWLTEHNYPWSRKDDVLLVDVAPPEALKILDLCRPHLRDFEYLHGTMEEVFLKLTGENLRETGGNND